MSEIQIQKNFAVDFHLFDSFPDMCFIVDSKGTILISNISAQIKLNAPIRKNSTNFFNLIEENSRGKTIKFFSDCLSESKSRNFHTKFKVEENLIDVEILISPYWESGDKNQRHCFVLARDTSEERQRELDLLRFYNVAEKALFPLQITNDQGNIVYVNPAYETASGYSKEELIGKNPKIFGSGKHPKQFWENMWKTINKGKVWVSEVENRRKDGQPFYTQLLISPIIDNEGKMLGFFGVHRDLSEKKLLEKQLVHSQKMESIGTLAAGIAHEVGNPLASISALVQVIHRTTNDNLVKEKLELVKSQVTRISKIIRDLVDFSRPSNYELRLTDINQNILEAVNITKVGAKAKDITFNFRQENKIPLLPLIADQIEQVFINILLNAVDSFADLPASVKKEKEIEIITEVSGDQLVITFTDNGSGISDQNLVKIFEPFFTTKKEGKGTGLGLWVSYGIVKSIQGDIRVKSKLGEGTTFTITLPINPK